MITWAILTSLFQLAPISASMPMSIITTSTPTAPLLTRIVFSSSPRLTSPIKCPAQSRLSVITCQTCTAVLLMQMPILVWRHQTSIWLLIHSAPTQHQPHRISLSTACGPLAVLTHPLTMPSNILFGLINLFKAPLIWVSQSLDVIASILTLYLRTFRCPVRTRHRFHHCPMQRLC